MCGLIRKRFDGCSLEGIFSKLNCTFQTSLPAMDFDLPNEQSEMIENLDRNNLLIIDSDIRVLASLDTAFTNQGFRVVKHTRGECGLVSVQRQLPDCVLVEVDLMDMCGIELCRTVVDDATTCGIPVIVMSHPSTVSMMQRARHAGAHFYVAKPYDPKVMLHLVNDAIAESRSWICD